MNNITFSFLLTTIAGLSTTIGYFVIYVRGDKNKIISFFLSFAAGIMLLISIIDLLPSSYKYLHDYFLIFRLLIIILFFLIGTTLSNYLNHAISKKENNALKKVGILSFISIILHNIPEGIITFMASQVNFKLGVSLALAISFHNIPEGISIAIPLFYATKNKLKIFITVFIAGISELLGGIIAYLILMPFINDLVIGAILAITAGIMINIGIFNLLDESFSYNKKYAIIGFIVGILTMLISSFIT